MVETAAGFSGVPGFTTGVVGVVPVEVTLVETGPGGLAPVGFSTTGLFGPGTGLSTASVVGNWVTWVAVTTGTPDRWERSLAEPITVPLTTTAANIVIASTFGEPRLGEGVFPLVTVAAHPDEAHLVEGLAIAVK